MAKRPDDPSRTEEPEDIPEFGSGAERTEPPEDIEETVAERRPPDKTEPPEEIEETLAEPRRPDKTESPDEIEETVVSERKPDERTQTPEIVEEGEVDLTRTPSPDAGKAGVGTMSGLGTVSGASSAAGLDTFPGAETGSETASDPGLSRRSQAPTEPARKPPPSPPGARGAAAAEPPAPSVDPEAAVLDRRTESEAALLAERRITILKVSRLAILSLVFGCLAAAGPLLARDWHRPALFVCGVPAIFFGALAADAIRRNPHALSGRILAYVGMSMGLLSSLLAFSITLFYKSRWLY